VVLSREELARCVRDNPYPGQTDPKLLHAVFLPEVPAPGLAAWLADAERQVRAKGSQDEARCVAARSTCTPRAGTRAANCAACSPRRADRPRPG
jgi:hypothetical protein